MSKVVVAKIAGKKIGTGKNASSVTEKRVRDDAGNLLTIRTLDGRSKTFANDLTYVFTRNVAKARRENKQVTGATDRVPAKG